MVAPRLVAPVPSSPAFALLGMLLLGLALGACSSKPGPEDPALAAATGIPMGAPQATGVRFGPPGAHTASPSDDDDTDDGELPKHLTSPKAPSKPTPADPLDSAPGADAGAEPLPLPIHRPPHKKGTQI